MRLDRLTLMIAALGLAAAVPVRADVHVAVQDGRVAISAKDATVAEILAEWARVADMIVVNTDKLPQDRVTLELQNVTEREALDVLLRAMGGYIARRRVGAQRIDHVMIMAPSAPIAPPPPERTAKATAAPYSYAPRVSEPAPDVAEPVAAAPAPEPEAPAFTAVIGSVADSMPAPTPDEEAATAVAQAAIRSRRALETVNPRDFVLPKKGGS